MLRIKDETIAKYLKKGDEVLPIASSSLIKDKKSIIEGLEVFEKWGLRVRPYNFIERTYGYLAGNDEVRFNELHHQTHSNLIACARGGWGAARLLEKHQPWRSGWLLGYSDISSLLLSRLTAGFDGGIHGPLISSLGKEPEWSQERLKNILFGKSVPDLVGESWHRGIAKGPLVASNLTVASHLLGSSHMPDLDGCILILEDTNESPYRIDRMLTQWRLTGILQKLAGIGFGDFKSCRESEKVSNRETFQIEDILKERCLDLQVPIVGNLPIGHCYGNAALPLGRIALLDGDKGLLKIPSA